MGAKHAPRLAGGAGGVKNGGVVFRRQRDIRHGYFRQRVPCRRFSDQRVQRDDTFCCLTAREINFFQCRTGGAVWRDAPPAFLRRRTESGCRNR